MRTVVFILSSDRSGSTWLGYVLGSTPHASFLGEFRRAWAEGLRQQCSWCSANGRQVCEVLAGIEQYSADRAYEFAFSRIRKQFLVDSSKRISWAERFVAPDTHFNVRFIHLIRDPRGWYASERLRRQGGVTEMLEEWVSENLHIRNFLHLSNVPSTTVFYDELAASPISTFQQLCTNIDFPFEPSALCYWEKAHHGFAANGASSSLLSSASHISELSDFVTGDDAFYASNHRKSFVDQRWKDRLDENEVLAISENFRVAAFLNLYDRALIPNGLHHLTDQERSLHHQLEGKFVRAPGNTPQLEKIYFIRNGLRHWVISADFIERASKKVSADVKILPLHLLERIPVASPVRN